MCCCALAPQTAPNCPKMGKPQWPQPQPGELQPTQLCTSQEPPPATPTELPTAAGAAKFPLRKKKNNSSFYLHELPKEKTQNPQKPTKQTKRR